MQVEINEILLRTIHQLAEELGRSEEEIMETAVLFYVQSLRMLSGSLNPDSAGIGAEIREIYVEEPPARSLEELFSEAERWQRKQGVKSLSEEEAMELANEELHAMRRERRSARQSAPYSIPTFSSLPEYPHGACLPASWLQQRRVASS